MGQRRHFPEGAISRAVLLSAVPFVATVLGLLL